MRKSGPGPSGCRLKSRHTSLLPPHLAPSIFWPNSDRSRLVWRDFRGQRSDRKPHNRLWANAGQALDLECTLESPIGEPSGIRARFILEKTMSTATITQANKQFMQDIFAEL